MKRDEFEKILEVSAIRGGPTSQYARFAPVLAPLYNAGCSVPQLQDLFGVSKKFVRTHLTRDSTYKARPSGPREEAAIPKPEHILAILKKHGLTLDDLPGPRPKRKDGPSKAKSTSTAKRAKKKP